MPDLVTIEMANNQIFYEDFLIFDTFLEKFICKFKSLLNLNLAGNKLVDKKFIPKGKKVVEYVI